MFSIMIVDDDPITRDWFKNEIEWGKLGYSISYIAENGIDALHKLNNYKIDVVICDIDMPKMDGIDLFSAIKEYNLCPTVVLIYDQVDYSRVKLGILMGIYDYLEKPLNKDRLTFLLNKIHKELSDKRIEDEKNLKLKEKLEMNITYSREKILYDILRGKEIPVKVFDDIIRDYNINIYKRMVQVGVVEIGNFDADSREWIKSGKFEHIIKSVREKISQVLNEFRDLSCVIVDIDIGILSMIVQPLQDGEPKKFEEMCETFFDNVLQGINNGLNVRATIGVGNLCSKFNEVSVSYMGAKAALRHKYILGGNRVIYISQFDFAKKSNLLYPAEREKMLTECIMLGDDKAIGLAKNLFNEINVGNEDERIKRLAFAVNQLVFNIWQYIENQYDFINKLYDFRKFTQVDFSKFENKEKMEEFFVLFVQDLLAIVKKYKPAQDNMLIKKACEYVLQHLEEEVTLFSIAEYLNISKNYFCSLFKQETGQNFLEYVTNVKMEWAKRLLKEGSLKTYQVSDMLGYREASYFSRLFRKYTGCSPAEFKKKVSV